ncbi:hypothetical protein RclHR1_04930010 [Rhizophagus clarus]|uniref:BTB/POZ protein n=1 Tax=Rhizophagus clarus TaxID=94130 RepID=A0A2Z6RQ33_9GLOM|nr:hypothetical protein RclHR1_04930010 [Rhizophagus clarus]GES84937.1 BTB/POZ protein [Rhizophagus clarus]
MSYDFSQEVINDLEKLFFDETGYDVIIYAGENENIKELHAHSCILCMSQYFNAAFSNNWVKRKDGKFIFEKLNVSPELFRIVLRFIYCGKIDFTELQRSDVLKILFIAKELNINHRDEFLRQNPVEMLETIYKHELLIDLWNYCLETICEEPKILFESDKFTSLEEPVLKSLLERDDLRLNEIEIWDNLLKWSLVQNPSISQDITKWSCKDVEIIETTFHKFIPLMKFYEIYHQKI